MNTSEAVRLYLAPQPDRYTGPKIGEPSEADLWTAGQIASKWRKDGPGATAAILYALHVMHNYSHGEIHRRLDIPTTTISRLIEQRREEVAAGG